MSPHLPPNSGEARSSQNSLQHGLYSKSSLLPDEDRELLQKDSAPASKPAAVQSQNGFVPPPHFTVPPSTQETPAVPLHYHHAASHPLTMS
jgi:hypothetical protein